MLELLDYRRRVFEMYLQIRQLGTDSPKAFSLFKQERDFLFGKHPQSALDESQKASFRGLKYWDYKPDYRVLARLEKTEEQVFELDAGADGTVKIAQIGKVSFDLGNRSGSIGVYWIRGYGGGIFIPFRDSSNNHETYGGGRYLYDSIKGADLGTIGDELVLDFNYAYHPSCYYNPRWTCPLAPMQNRLSFAVEAGEQILGT